MLKFAQSARSFSYYVTTPIFYVNASPHLGHVHSLLLADALNIYKRLCHPATKTIFSTGTDEHGIKVQSAAAAQNLSPQELCDLNADKFFEVFRQYDTTYTEFIRTTEVRHKRCVESVWRQLQERGFIYKDKYSGWYCSSDETFVSDVNVKEVEDDGKIVRVDQSGNVLTWSSEENYVFRLNSVHEEVEHWLKQEKPIYPEKFNTDAIRLLEQIGHNDISISRPKERSCWGVSVPGDPDQTIYVWLDALTNYLTAVGYPCDVGQLKRWPVDCHVMGKDIIKFHAIYWPSFLTALSLSLPKRLICHSHWLIDSFKMSKSRGNVVDPRDENKELTVEGLRYFLLRAGTLHSDTDYDRSQAKLRINSEVANTYGNLLMRCMSNAINPKQVIPAGIIESLDEPLSDLKDILHKLPDKCAILFERGEFHYGIDEIMAALRKSNSIFEHYAPWKLVKNVDLESHRNLNNILALTFETLRICSILLQPVIPKTSSHVLNCLGISERSWDHARYSLVDGQKTRPLSRSREAVFPRLQIGKI